jgi:uncharacterized cupin superfamily protein
MERLNIFNAELQFDEGDPEGYNAGYLRFGEKIGATMLGGTLYGLATGQSICPYHYEYGNEEWVIVLAGRPVLRHPEGEDGLEPGDAVCFPVGPAGAHKLTNTGEETVRLALPLDETRSVGRGVPGQRQDRDLAGRAERQPARAAGERRRLLGPGAVGAGTIPEWDCPGTVPMVLSD